MPGDAKLTNGKVGKTRSSTGMPQYPRIVKSRWEYRLRSGKGRKGARRRQEKHFPAKVSSNWHVRAQASRPWSDRKVAKLKNKTKMLAAAEQQRRANQRTDPNAASSWCEP